MEEDRPALPQGPEFAQTHTTDGRMRAGWTGNKVWAAAHPQQARRRDAEHGKRVITEVWLSIAGSRQYVQGSSIMGRKDTLDVIWRMMA